MVKRATRGLGCRLIFEPGRLIVGNAGILVTRVLYVKRGEAKTFVIVDAGMNDLVRPTLYDAHHDIRPVHEPAAGAPQIIADIVGPVCESGDFIALDRSLVAPQPGDLLAIMSAGAYGAVQAGTYNSRALVPEVLVRADEWALVRPRVTAAELIALDRFEPAASAWICASYVYFGMNRTRRAAAKLLTRDAITDSCPPDALNLPSCYGLVMPNFPPRRLD